MIRGLLVLILMFSLNAFGQSQVLKEQLMGFDNRFQMVSQMAAYSNVYDVNSVDHSSQSVFTLAPSYRFRNGLRLRGGISLMQTHGRRQKAEASNARVSLTAQPLSLFSGIQLIPQVSGRLPTNEDAREQASYQGAVSIEPTFVYSLTSLPLTVIYTSMLNKTFHRYTSNALGSANVEYSAPQVVSLDYNFGHGLSAALTGVYEPGWTYQGSLRTQYAFEQSVIYAMNDQVSFNLGHSNGGSLFYGTGGGVEWFDKNTSTFFGSVRMVH